MGSSLFTPVAIGTIKAFENLDVGELTPAGTGAIMVDWALIFLQALLPLAGILIAVGLVFGLLQSRFAVSGKPLMPDFSRLNPISGLKRILSLRTLVDLAKGLIKLGLIGYVAYREVAALVLQSPNLMGMNATVGLTFIASRLISAMQLIGLCLIGLGVLDYIYQWWEFRKSLRMTKHEVKQEHKQQEGQPEVKQRQRQRARELARRRRAIKEVPTADVVITNPTHYAVALRYTAGKDAAPMIIAKGTDLLAQRIKVLAKQHDVPMVENRPLARGLFAAAEVGESVPQEFYQAVAEVLAFVYSLRRQQRRSPNPTSTR